MADRRWGGIAAARRRTCGKGQFIMCAARSTLVRIDGRHGEGGGQVLRSSLTCSLITGQGFEIDDVRAKRTPPGLKAQHLEAVRAAQAVGEAEVDGAQLGSRWVRFVPRRVVAGEHDVRIRTAGAAPLVVQTVLLPLSLVADGPSRLRVLGGTHVEHAPCHHYLEYAYLPACARLGLRATLHLERPGYYPRGGGEMHVQIVPVGPNALRGIDWSARGDMRSWWIVSHFSDLPEHIGTRAVAAAQAALQPARPKVVASAPSRAANPGGAILAAAHFEHGIAAYQALARRGRPAEQLGRSVGERLAAFVAGFGADAAEVPSVDAHLADQLLLPAAFARGESRWRTEQVTQHLLTHADVIRRFVPCEIDIAGELGAHNALVSVRPT